MECPFDSIKTQYELWSDFENKNLETHTQLLSKMNSRNEKLDNLQLFTIDNNFNEHLNNHGININKYSKIYTNELNKKMYQYYINNFN